MRIKTMLLTLAVGLLHSIVPMGAYADAPQPPAGPEFNTVQIKVLADNDFAVFMGNDLEITRLFYQNNVSWYAQVENIQTLNVYPENGETFIYIVPLGGDPGYREPGEANLGEENWSGVLNGIPLLDYPGGEVAVGRRVADDRDIIHTGYLLLNSYLQNYATDRVAEKSPESGTYDVTLADIKPASQNLVWSPATRSSSPVIPDPVPNCVVSCDGNRFSPAITSGGWDIPDASAALFRYPLSNANLPVSPGDRQVTVSWKDPGAGGAVDNYLIEYKESSEPDASYKTFGRVAADVRSSTVTGLTNGTAYTLRVSANNISGSASSVGRSVVPTGTPSRPANQSYGAGDTSVEINFNPPENDGGMAVTNYAYSTDDGATWISRTPASTASPLLIPNLINGTTYSVKLRAINPFGAGTPSLPISVKAGVVATRSLTYDAGTLAPIQGLAAGGTFTQNQQFTVAQGPTRPSYTFTGWKDGAVPYQPGDTYTVGSGNPTLTAQWIQDSLLGTSPSDRSRVLTWNIIEDQGIDTTVSAGSNNSVKIQIPANALAAGTEVVFWRLFDDKLAKAKISDSNNYFVNLAITWFLGDDINTPQTVQIADIPIVLTITNSSIVSGATAWQIVGDSVRVVGNAERDGELVLRFTEDPVITAANVSPIPQFSSPIPTADGFLVDITNFDEQYGWEDPSVSLGEVAITATSGITRSLAVTGLTAGQSATISQRSFLNGVYQNGTVTGTAIPIPPAPDTSSPPPAPPTPVLSTPPLSVTQPGITGSKPFVLTGFKPGSWQLSKAMKKTIDSLLRSGTKPKSVSCDGYTMGPTVLRADQRLANRRALEVCRYIAAKDSSVAIGDTKGITTKSPGAAWRRATVSFYY